MNQRCPRCGGLLMWEHADFGLWIWCLNCGRGGYMKPAPDLGDTEGSRKGEIHSSPNRDAVAGGYEPQRLARDLAQG